MAKVYRAKVGFSCPADPESLKKWKAGHRDEAKILEVKKGQKLEPYNADIEKSWLAADVVEEVS